MNRRSSVRVVARTVLLVGEGDSEEEFLRYLKGLYVERGSGVAVTIKNARGKGAGHVVDYARRQAMNAQYDVTAALLDTDTDWTDATRKRAKQVGVYVLPCEPCLEALLLSLGGEATEGKNTEQLKKAFVRKFGSAASEVDWSRYLDLNLVNTKSALHPVLSRLIDLLLRAEVPR